MIPVGASKTSRERRKRTGSGVSVVVYPAAVVSTSTQAVWDLRTWTGWRTPPAKILGDGTLGTTAPPAGWALSSVYGLTTIAHNPTSLEGYDTNGRGIVIRHNGATVRDNKVWNNGTWNNGLDKSGVRIGDGQSVLDPVIEYNEIDGLGETQAPTAFSNISQHGSTTASYVGTIIRGNYCHGSGGDSINVEEAGALIEWNRVEVGGWRRIGAHWDGIQCNQTNPNVGVTTIRNNLVVGAPGRYPNGTVVPWPDATVGMTGCMTQSGMKGGYNIHHNIFVGHEIADSGVYENPAGSGTVDFRSPFKQSVVMFNGQRFNDGHIVEDNVFSFPGALSLSGVYPGNFNGLQSFARNYRLSMPEWGGSLVNDNVLLPYPTTVALTSVAAPTVTGTGSVGQVLTASQGSINGGIQTWAYQWLRNGLAIAGATTRSYTVQAADSGTTLTFRATATNDKGSLAHTSSGLSIPASGAAPSNSSLPDISGIFVVDEIISCSTGAWSGSSPITYTYQWKRNGGAIGGATASDYTLVPADGGYSITCTVTATNSFGNSSATSASVGPITFISDPGVSSVNADGWTVTYTNPPTSIAPSDNKIVALSRAGFDSTGSVTTYAEQLLLTQRLRKPYSTAYSQLASASYNNAGVISGNWQDPSKVAIEDYVYSTDQLLGGGTNNSGETSPKPIASWATFDRTTVGDSIVVEIVAAHRNARNGEQVACVEFSATDGTNSIAPVKVSASVVSGNPADLNSVIVYKATLNIAALNDNSTITVNCKVYPWIGNASSVLDSSANTAGTRTFCPQVYYKSTARAAAVPAYVYVSSTGVDATVLATGATAGSVQKVSATAATAAANPFLTVGSAHSALIAATNLTSGKVDACIIRIVDQVAPGAAPAAAQNLGSDVIIEGDPLAGAGVPVILLTTNWGTRMTYMRLRGNITLKRNGSGAWQLTNTTQLNVEGATMDCGATANNGVWVSGCLGKAVGLTVLNSTNLPFSVTAANHWPLLRGVTAGSTSVVSTFDAFGLMGSILTNSGANLGGVDPEVGSMIAFNKFFKCVGATITTTGGNGGVGGTSSQLCVLQNVIEYVSATSQPSFRMSGDDATNNLTHVVVHNNTFAGYSDWGRANVFYNETSGTARVHKLLSSKNNIHVQLNSKQDSFHGCQDTGNAAANQAESPSFIGGWPGMYGVGWANEMILYADAQNQPASSGSAFAQAFSGVNASWGAAGSPIDPLFTSPAHTTAGSPATAGAGAGTYTLQAGSPAAGRVSKPTLKFDLAGASRLSTNDSCGAYAA